MSVDPTSKAAIQSSTSDQDSRRRRRDVWRSLKCWVRSQRDQDKHQSAIRMGSTASDVSTLEAIAPDGSQDLNASWESAPDAGTYPYWAAQAEGCDSGAQPVEPCAAGPTSAALPAPAETPPSSHKTVDSWLARAGPTSSAKSAKSANSAKSPVVDAPEAPLFFEDMQDCEGVPRTASECSDYWGQMQAQETADRAQKSSGDSPETSFSRPATMVNAEQADCVKTKVLEVRNSQLEDRVAELERQLLALAAAAEQPSAA